MELEDTEIESDTPKSKKQGKLTTQFQSEDENSLIESEDDFYATPKALQKNRRPTVHCSLDPASDFSNDKSDSLDQAEWKNESEMGEESDDKSNRYEISKNGKREVGKPKTIDLAQMQKPKGKAKRAFRMEVEERRAVTTTGDGKKETVSNRSFDVNCSLIVAIFDLIVIFVMHY